MDGLCGHTRALVVCRGIVWFVLLTSTTVDCCDACGGLRLFAAAAHAAIRATGPAGSLQWRRRPVRRVLGCVPRCDDDPAEEAALRWCDRVLVIAAYFPVQPAFACCWSVAAGRGPALDWDAAAAYLGSGVADVSLEGVVRAMRKQRHPWMVEGAAQYEFAYRVVLAELEGRVVEE